jgi:gluconokinase
MDKYFVGVDLGTGSTKAVAVNNAGETICTSQHYYPTINLKPGNSEQVADLIWQAFVKCINEVTMSQGEAPVAIGLSSAMHSIMPVTEEGKPLANAILWADSRSSDIAQQIRDSALGEDIYRHTGTAIYAMSPLCKLAWLRQNEPEIFQQAHKFISIKEYIWYKLFGVFEVDYSIASATGLFDILDLKWYDKACEFAGVSTDKLSAPVNTNHKRSLATQHNVLTGINLTTHFVIGASDGCCANLGGNAVRAGIAALTIGTSGAVRVSSNTPIYNYGAMTFNYLLNENTFICGGAVNNGGAAVNWLLKDFLKVTDINNEAYSKLFASIETVKAGSEGLIFLPYLYAERAPLWDAKSSAGFLNITFKHKQEHFLRAALEGICFALYDVINAVEASSQIIEEIVISGGFISSPVWVQILADITGKKLVLQQTEDASAIGAVYLAMGALNINTEPIYEREAKDKVLITPDGEAHKVYSKMFPLYIKLYKDLKESMHLMRALAQE